MNPVFRSAIIAAALFIVPAIQAQETTEEGYLLNWDKTITVVPDQMTNGKYKLPAWTVSIYEADASDVLHWWEDDMKSVSVKVSGSRPAKAIGARLGLPEAAVTTTAMTAADKRAKLVKLTIGFGLNDSTALPTDAGQQDHVHGLAVKYNKLVVQRQIEDKQKDLAKVTGDLADAQAEETKLKEKADEGKADLAKIKAKKGEIQAGNADISGDVSALEKKYALSNDPKDLEKLTKTRKKLVDREADLAGLAQDEARTQAAVNKYEGQLPANAEEQKNLTAGKEQLEAEIAALRRKQDNIR